MKHVKPYCRWRLFATSCMIALVAMVAVVPWRVVAQDAPPEPGSTSLSDAVKQFNAEAKASKIGKDQPPLTEDEVVAAIRWTVYNKPYASATAAEYAALEKVADTKRLPPDGRFEVQTGFAPGDELVYTIWSVRLQIPRGQPYLTYGFPIRDRYVTVGRADPYQSDSPPSRRRFNMDLRPVAEKIDESLPTLADAVKKFNAESAAHPIGKNQPPLTEEEVTAALYWTEMDRKLKDVTDKEYAALERVAKTGRIPKDADFEVVTGFIPGDGNAYEKWSVRLRMPGEKVGSNYGFSVREQFLKVRPTDPQETDSPRPKISIKEDDHDLAAVDAPAMLLQAADSTADPATNNADNKLAKPLIGSWRGGPANSLVKFKADGTFEGMIGTLLPQGSNVSSDGYTHGKWRVDTGPSIDGELRWLHLDQSFPGNTIRGLPSLPPRADVATVTSWKVALQILQVDAKFLRLDYNTGLNDNGAIFLRRVENEKDVKPKIDPALPADVCQLAELVSLTPDEVAALAADKVDHLQAWDINQKQINQLLRLAAARRTEVDFAELFELDKDEIEAYARLYKFTCGNFSTVRTLLEQGQLTDVETRAAKKIDAAVAEMAKTIDSISGQLSAEARSETIPSPPFALSTPPRARAIGRLYHGLYGLSMYMNGFLFPAKSQQ